MAYLQLYSTIGIRKTGINETRIVGDFETPRAADLKKAMGIEGGRGRKEGDDEVDQS